MLLMPAIGLWNAPLNQSLHHLSTDLGLGSTAWANGAFQYKPPQRGLPRTTQGTGSRGCTQSEPVTLALVVPKDHNGQTLSGHPTFFWHVSNQTSVPVEFALVEPGVAKPLFVQRMRVQQPGIMQASLPKELPELATGRKYRWSVSLICDSNRPSNNVFVQSWIERVSAKPDLTQQLAALPANDTSAQTLQEKARIYGQAGLWYNALETLYTASNANPNNTSLKTDFLSLLEQGGVTQISAREGRGNRG